MADPMMKGGVVVTTIAAPNDVMRRLAADCADRDMPLIIIGDTKSPAEFHLQGARYFSVDDQLKTDLAFARLCPTRHYARKNIGYLLAMRAGVDFIVETDDDNMPSPEFYEPIERLAEHEIVETPGWCNVYAAFDDRLIWPRGLPLDRIAAPPPDVGAARRVDAPIQQGLADENPDVDAIYRLILPLPFSFRRRRRVALGSGTWCPYNSQNTIHFADAYPLLYLPAHCSFRMTDIWRSFVAQRIAWANGWSILFREATVVQDRNDHDLMRDFADEVPGYNGNTDIARRLEAVSVEPGRDGMLAGLRDCYATLIDGGHVGEGERPLVEAWISDLNTIADAKDAPR